MKNIIIRIQDISEIDTSKISVYDLNNRYINKQGEMYGLKYNMTTKRVEIIKLRRAHASEAAAVNQQLQKKKIDEKEKAFKEEKLTSRVGVRAESPPPPVSEMKMPPDNYNAYSSIKEINEMASTHKSRLGGIISNLQKSNYIKDTNRADKISLEAYFRTINIECLQKLEKLENSQKELLYYPRSIAYYTAKLDNQGREFIDKLNQDKEKILKFIYYFEMLHSMRNIYQMLKKILNDLVKFLTSLEQQNLNTLERHEKQAYQDALMSINSTLKECELTLDNLKLFEKFIYDIEKY